MARQEGRAYRKLWVPEWMEQTCTGMWQNREKLALHEAVWGAVLYSDCSVPTTRIIAGFSFHLLIRAISHLGFPSIESWQCKLSGAESQGYFILAVRAFLPTSFIHSQSGWYANNGRSGSWRGPGSDSSQLLVLTHSCVLALPGMQGQRLSASQVKGVPGLPLGLCSQSNPHPRLCWEGLEVQVPKDRRVQF